MQDIDKCFNDFTLPINVKKDSDYYTDLCRIFDEYIDHMASVKIDESCKSAIGDNCENIKNAIQEYYKAHFSEAENLITKVLEKYIDSPFIVAPMNENYAFKGVSSKKLQPSIYRNKNKEFYEKMQREEIVLYRARNAIKKLKKNDMLHIPFNQRELVATQRFSMPGIPCFYFATTSFGAWLEMGMPDTAMFQVSAYLLPKKLKILNLCQEKLFIDGSATYIETEDERKNLYDFLQIYPLVIATSYRVLDNNRNFKSEYIIPQLIMRVARKLQIDGIAYLSKRMEDSFAYPQCVNLAILIPYIEDKNVNYWSKMSDIIMTEPHFIKDMLSGCCYTEQTFINKYYSVQPYSLIKLADSKLEYSKLEFSKFDNYLQGQLLEMVRKELENIVKE